MAEVRRLTVPENYHVRLNPGQAAMFGYGSLILLESMERTLGRPYSLPRYACGLRGWRRSWTSLYPNSTFYFTDPNGEPAYPKNILYLNIGRAQGSLNGVIYIIDDADLPAFDKREYIYDRVDVGAEIFGLAGSELQISGGPVWAYVGKDPYVMTGAMPKMEAAVRASYVRIVEKGLDEFGAEFREEYQASSEPVPEANLMDDHQG